MSFLETYRDVAKRLLGFIDGHQTHYAEDLFEVPLSFFSSPEQFEREIERIFHRVPLFVALSSDLAAPGSWRTLNVLNTPVLLVRATDGTIKAYLNVCRRRGVPVADGQGEGARRFTCPFHAWTYDLDGALVGVPHASAFEGLCREERGLVALPAAEKHGLVFIRLRPGDPIHVDEHLGGLGPELSEFGFEGFQAVNDPHIHRIPANWKLVMDTFNEIYHFGHLHRDTGSNLMYGDLSTIDQIGPHIRHGFASRSVDTLRDVPEQAWEAILHTPYHYILFPNVSATIVSVPESEFQPATNKLEFNQIFPVGINNSMTLHCAYTTTQDFDDEARQRELEMIKYSCTAVLDAQDYWVAGQEQLTLRTGANRSMLYGRNERGCQLFNHTILAATNTTMAELETWNAAQLGGGSVGSFVDL